MLLFKARDTYCLNHTQLKKKIFSNLPFIKSVFFYVPNIISISFSSTGDEADTGDGADTGKTFSTGDESNQGSVSSIEITILSGADSL
jgi:hypothetical protein